MNVNNGKEMIFCVKVSRLTGVRVCTVYTTTAPVVQYSYCTTTEVYYFNFVLCGSVHTVTKVICF